MNNRAINFTEGKILGPLLRFAVPILLGAFLHALYGAVDLLIVGRFSLAADVSGVSTGSMLMSTLTSLVASLSVGLTVFLAEMVGQKNEKEGGRIIGSGIVMFFVIAVVMMAVISGGAGFLARLMNAPEEAMVQTTQYIRICGLGFVVIIAYSLISGVFRGIGDSVTPLIAVIIACIANIGGDLLLVGGLNMGAKGAAIATVAAQGLSVVLSLVMVRKKPLPFKLERGQIRPDGTIIKKIVRIGAPLALQDVLSNFSFLAILAIINGLGVIVSAGVGVTEKVCFFIMLIPLAFMQALAAFVAQNRGAGKLDRAEKGLRYAVTVSFLIGVVMFWLAFFHGDLLTGIFASDPAIIAAGVEYLKAYGIDILLVGFVFCFIGYFNGMEHTRFVMIQGIACSFLIRLPIAFIMSRQTPPVLFRIGLGIPASTAVQILLCVIFFLRLRRKARQDSLGA
ncbi:MAG: MATE family efflux transporter [Lachnospiraceae bacterium]|nr:MATE family efflux transporter [Lachnospiraceae bacterium]